MERTNQPNQTDRIEWDDRFRTGIEAVDFEHQELITGINFFFEGVASARPHDDSRADLGEIFAKISAHFALEERKMRAMSGYADYPAHKADHERLLDDIRDIMDEFDSDDAPELSEWVPRLEQWFLGHFSTFDAKLHRGVGG